MNIEIKELTYKQSKQLLYKFQKLEKSYGTDWYDCEEKDAKYIWLIKNIEHPLGFLSYKILVHPNQIDFIYIVKIYVLENYRDKNPQLIKEERVFNILFRQIHRKGVNILTLESACEKLDIHYESFGFENNKEMSDFFAPIIGTNEQIMTKFIKEPELSAIEKELFG